LTLDLEAVLKMLAVESVICTNENLPLNGLSIWETKERRFLISKPIRFGLFQLGCGRAPLKADEWL